jgi:uncharacterized protein
MTQINSRYSQVSAGPSTGVVADEGLRAYMLRVYNYMAGGVLVTGIVAYLVSSAAITTGPTSAKVLTQFGQLIYVTSLKWVIMLAPLAFVFFISFRIYKMSVAGAQLAFWLFAAAMGLSLSSIFLVYTGQSITQVFFVTAAVSTPERNCIGEPEQKSITGTSKKAPDIGGLLAFAFQS